MLLSRGYFVNGVWMVYPLLLYHRNVIAIVTFFCFVVVLLCVGWFCSVFVGSLGFSFDKGWFTMVN